MQSNTSVYVLADVFWQSNNEQCLLPPWMITVPGTVRRSLLASIFSLCASGFLAFFQSLCFQLSSITTSWLSSVALSCPLSLIFPPGQRVNLFSFASCWTCTSDQCCCEMPCYRVLQTLYLYRIKTELNTVRGKKICSVLLITNYIRNLLNYVNEASLHVAWHLSQAPTIPSCEKQVTRSLVCPVHAVPTFLCLSLYPVLLHLLFRAERAVTIIIVSIPETSASIVYGITIFQFSLLVLN